MRNLAHRLSCRPPLGYRGAWFRFRGKTFNTYANLIDLVLERYARRFGFINADLSSGLQSRLANKYSSNANSTLKSVRFGGQYEWAANVYPRSKAKQILRQCFIIEDIQWQYDRPDGPYCLLASKRGTCLFCGDPLRFEIVNPDKKVKHFDNSVYLNKTFVCKRKICRAIVSQTKIPRKYSEYPIIHVLMEATKHGGDNTYKRRLEKHFIRDAR